MVQFNTQISQPNFSDPTSLQYNWATVSEACLRPSKDFDIPIVCEVTKKVPDEPDYAELPNLGAEYETFKNCCLTDPPHDGQGVQWAMLDPCLTQYCFVTNETVAAGFDECIVGSANEAFSKLGFKNISGSDPPYRGNCGYIDYDSIKKGVRESSKVGAATALSPRLGSYYLALSLAIAGSVLSSAM